MRKLFLSAFVVLSLFAVANAQVVFTENFDYAAGALLTANGYLGHSGAGTNAQTVVTGSLTYTGYAASGIGNSIKLVN
ncbi:MAG: hypothetical protein HYV28_17805 [Ignavibacteriales bacterium]|nr:hypothetical protein [Ignavibacteriales bacterium]